MLLVTMTTLFVFADDNRQDDNRMLTVMWINLATTAVFIGVFIALVKR